MLFLGGDRNLLFLEKPHLSHVLIKNPTAVTASEGLSDSKKPRVQWLIITTLPNVLVASYSLQNIFTHITVLRSPQISFSFYRK